MPPDVPHEEPFVHSTAVVEPGASLGVGTAVWHFSHVRAGAVLGAECMLGQSVYVAETVRLGDRVRVQNGVSLFNGVTLEGDVFVGPSVVFTNDRFPRATHSERTFLRPTFVRRGASLGAGSVVLCGLEIGPWAMVGAGAVVTRDVPAFGLVFGNPARLRGWVCRCGLRLRRAGPSDWNCSDCARRYFLSHGFLLSRNDDDQTGQPQPAA